MIMNSANKQLVLSNSINSSNSNSNNNSNNDKYNNNHNNVNDNNKHNNIDIIVTPNLPTNIVAFRGFDSSTILI